MFCALCCFTCRSFASADSVFVFVSYFYCFFLFFLFFSAAFVSRPCSRCSLFSLLVQQKLVFSPKDQVGLVLFGTRETENDLQESGYNHIKVLRTTVLCFVMI